MFMIKKNIVLILIIGVLIHLLSCSNETKKEPNSDNDYLTIIKDNDLNKVDTDYSVNDFSVTPEKNDDSNLFEDNVDINSTDISENDNTERSDLSEADKKSDYEDMDNDNPADDDLTEKKPITDKIILHTKEYFDWAYIWDTTDSSLNKQRFKMTDEGNGWVTKTFDVTSLKIIFTPRGDSWGGKSVNLSRSKPGEYWYVHGQWYDHDITGLTDVPEQWDPTDQPKNVKKVTSRWFTLEKFNNDHGLETRNVHLYLPKNYTKSDERYPVIYIYDYNNVGAYKLDKRYDELIEKGLINPAIFVCLTTPPDRTGEYTDKREDYTKWIMHSLKPYIDSHYRTKHQAKFTGVIGTSHGGLLSLHNSWNYPEVFGMAGLVSTSFYRKNASTYKFLKEIVNYKGPKKSIRYWIDSSTGEGYYGEVAGKKAYIRNSRILAEKLALLGWNEGDDIAYYEDFGPFNNKTPSQIHGLGMHRRIRSILYFFLRKEKPALVSIKANSYLDSYSIDETQASISIELNYENDFKLTKIFNDREPEMILSSNDAKIFTVDKDGNINPAAVGKETLSAEFQGEKSSVDISINNDFTINYYNKNHTNKAYIHYKLGENTWSKAPGIPMDRIGQEGKGWWKKVVPSKDKEYITFSFNDDGSAWFPGWKGNDFTTSHRNIYVWNGIVYTYYDGSFYLDELQEKPKDEVVVLSLNLHTYQEDKYGKGDTLLKLDKVAKFINRVKADIVLLQECAQPKDGKVVSDKRASPLSDDLKEGGDKPNMATYISKVLSEKYGKEYSYYWALAHIGFDDYEEGVAIMTPHNMTDVDSKFLRDDNTYRKAVYSKINIKNIGNINAFSTHTGWGKLQLEEIKNLKELIASKEQSDTTVSIVGADFNAKPGSDGYKLLESGGKLLDSYKIANPNTTIDQNRIDYIMHTPSDKVSVKTSQFYFKFIDKDDDGKDDLGDILGGRVSDHFGLITRYKIK